MDKILHGQVLMRESLRDQFWTLFFSWFMLTVYNPGHNILALFNNLEQVQIATSKTILDI